MLRDTRRKYCSLNRKHYLFYLTSSSFLFNPKIPEYLVANAGWVQRAGDQKQNNRLGVGAACRPLAACEVNGSLLPSKRNLSIKRVMYPSY